MPAVRLPAVQLRDSSLLTSEAYVAQRGWQDASLGGCPRHPTGSCGFARHGTYPRQRPAGMRIARYYCPTAHETFSLLPDCLASRFPGDLDDLERVVAQVDAASSIEAAADVLRPDIVLPSAVRWVRRRLTLVRATLLAVVTLLPDRFGGDAHLQAVRAADDWSPDVMLLSPAIDDIGTRFGVTNLFEHLRRETLDSIQDEVERFVFTRRPA